MNFFLRIFFLSKVIKMEKMKWLDYFQEKQRSVMERLLDLESEAWY